MEDKIIFELGAEGRRATSFSACDVPEKNIADLLGSDAVRNNEADLPQLSELEVVRHFTKLSQKNFSVDTNFYPLGSCTMKYNPKINEEIASLPGFKYIHPYQPEDTVQGMLKVLYETEKYLCEICGMDAFSLMPAAGAHGEFLGLLLIRAYHTKKGNPRKKIILPDSSHGTNPASAHIAGYEVVTIPSNENGEVSLTELNKAVGEETAAVMITNPNTVGVFESQIEQIADIVHQKDALLYCDGANLNPLLGICRPGDLGFDVMHVNLHKTFSTPHGGGGPGSGPVGVNHKLEPFLPVPRVIKDENGYSFLETYPDSVGKIKAFYGNIEVIVKAYTYIKALGRKGLKQVGINAVLNANYLREKLKNIFDIPYGRDNCMHEFVISFKKEAKEEHVHAMDLAKYLLDQGIHAPTVYFPLIVEEAVMIEPTETETKETLDRFISIMKDIAQEIKKSPANVTQTPKHLHFCRFDEVLAARKPDLKWSK